MNQQMTVSLRIAEGRTEDWIAAARRWNNSSQLKPIARRHATRKSSAGVDRSPRMLLAMLGVCCLGYCLI
jgi:hypothetical protein